MASYSCHRHLSTISNTLALSIKPIIPFFSLSTLIISKKRCIMYMRQRNFVHLPHAEHSKKGYFSRRQEKRVRKLLIRTALFWHYKVLCLLLYIINRQQSHRVPSTPHNIDFIKNSSKRSWECIDTENVENSSSPRDWTHPWFRACFQGSIYHARWICVFSAHFSPKF